MKYIIIPKLHEQATVLNGVVITSESVLDKMIRLMTEADLPIISEKV